MQFLSQQPDASPVCVVVVGVEVVRRYEISDLTTVSVLLPAIILN